MLPYIALVCRMISHQSHDLDMMLFVQGSKLPNLIHPYRSSLQQVHFCPVPMIQVPHDQRRPSKIAPFLSMPFPTSNLGHRRKGSDGVEYRIYSKCNVEYLLVTRRSREFGNRQRLTESTFLPTCLTHRIELLRNMLFPMTLRVQRCIGTSNTL